MYLSPMMSPIPLSRAVRMAWSLLRHPVRSREFPARNERLITADELLRYGFRQSRVELVRARVTPL